MPIDPLIGASLVSAGGSLVGKLFDSIFGGGGGPEPQKPQMQSFRAPQMQAPQAPIPQVAHQQPVPGIGASAAGGGANEALQRAIQMFMGGGR